MSVGPPQGPGAGPGRHRGGRRLPRSRSAPLLARLTNVRKYAGPRLDSVVEGGVLRRQGRRRGPDRHRAGPGPSDGAEILLDGHRPRWIVSAGFGGALDPALRRNDVVLAPRGRERAKGDRFAIDLAEVPPVPRPQGLRTGPAPDGRRVRPQGVREGRIAAEVRGRRGRHGDLGPSPPSASTAGVRFLSVRVISDEAGVDLPPEILAIVGPSGGLRLGATIGALWKRPSSVKDLLGLRQHAVEAADRLARVPSLAGTLPPP